MYSLIRFGNGNYQIYESKRLIRSTVVNNKTMKKTVILKYKGCSYEGELISSSSDYNALENIKIHSGNKKNYSSPNRSISYSDPTPSISRSRVRRKLFVCPEEVEASPLNFNPGGHRVDLLEDVSANFTEGTVLQKSVDGEPTVTECSKYAEVMVSENIDATNSIGYLKGQNISSSKIGSDVCIINAGVATHRWTTPQREKVREAFYRYYEETKQSRMCCYPSKGELLKAINTLPEFSGKKPQYLKSKLQHEFRYLLSQIEEQEEKVDTEESDESTGTDKISPKNSMISNHTHKFTVRKSIRESREHILKERQFSIETLIRSQSEGLEIRQVKGKGRGVFTSKNIKRGDFVVEYSGELITSEEAGKREKRYAQNNAVGCYMYYFKYDNKRLCIDATSETDKHGRLINHSIRYSNIYPKLIVVNSVPRIVFFAKYDIKKGQELLYDYGDRRYKSLKYHPWLRF